MTAAPKKLRLGGRFLTAADEIRNEGLRAAALDPYGAGLCLVLAGLFLAARLWSSTLVLPSSSLRDVFL